MNAQRNGAASSSLSIAKVTREQFLAKDNCDVCHGRMIKPSDAPGFLDLRSEYALWCHPTAECWSSGIEMVRDAHVKLSGADRSPDDTVVSFQQKRHSLGRREKRQGSESLTAYDRSLDSKKEKRLIASHVFCPCEKCGTRLYRGKTQYNIDKSKRCEVTSPTENASMSCRVCR